MKRWKDIEDMKKKKDEIEDQEYVLRWCDEQFEEKLRTKEMKWNEMTKLQLNVASQLLNFCQFSNELNQANQKWGS